MTLYERELLLGQWFRQEIDEHGNQFIEIADFTLDGTFQFCFTTQSKQGDVIEKVTELGDWGLVGDIHFTITKNEVIEDDIYAADLDNAQNYQAYKVVALTAEYFQYQHVVSNESYTLRRISDFIGHC